MKTRCVLIIGHSEKSQGARNPQTGITEYQYNEMLAECIENVFALRPEHDIELIVWRRKKGYKSLPEEINKLEPDFIVSMHCNAFDRMARGREFLYSGSNEGKILAASMCTVSARFMYRGIKPRTIKQRGGLLLHRTKAPCVICEPFFIDNRQDFHIAREMFIWIAQDYCDGIIKAAKRLE